MKDNFKFSRFGKYFLYDIKTLKANIGTLFLIAVLVPLLLYLLCKLYSSIYVGDNVTNLLRISKSTGPELTGRMICACIVAPLFLMIFPAKAYGFITDKAKGSAWLMLPATKLEKFISMLLNSLIVVPLAFFLGYLLVDWIICLADSSCGTSLIAGLSDYAFGFEVEDLFQVNGIFFLISSTLNTVSIFLLGTLLIKKKSWKIAGTILVNLAICVVISWIAGLLISSGIFDGFGDVLEDWVLKNVHNMDRYFNVSINLYLLVVVGLCTLGDWLRIKRLQL